MHTSLVATFVGWALFADGKTTIDEPVSYAGRVSRNAALFEF